MKRHFLIISVVLLLSANTLLGQDIQQRQVPSVVVNSFQKKFPKARDIEWEIKGSLYKAEFETGLLGADHEAWYDKTGKMVRHEEEISKSDLPKKIIRKIDNTYSGYRVSDVDKITEGTKVIYLLELKTITEEWKITLDAEGNILSKVAD